MTLYRLGSSWMFYWFGCLLSLCLGPLHAQTTNVRGFVRDSQGKPIVGAIITLKCDPTAASATPPATTSDIQGQFTFTVIPKLPCRLEASALGLTAKTKLDLTPAQGTHLIMAPDLVLSAPERGTPTEVSTQTSAPPTFQASGIRGLIDQGGYSAPAGAAAASSLLSGMADVHRSIPDAATANIPPCAALSSLLQAAQEHPRDVEGNRILAEFYLAHGQASLALPYLRSAHEGSPTDKDVLRDLARAQIAREQFAEAKTTLSEIPSPSIDSQAHELLAQAAEGLGMFDEAATQYSLAQEGDPSIENIFSQGYELILAAHLPAAENVFQDGLKRFPKSVRLLIGKGVAEYLGGLSAASVTTFLAAVTVNPADAQAYPFLAQAYLVSGEHADEVRAALTNHLARSTGDGTAYYLLALVLSRANSANLPGDEAETATLLRKAITLDPDLFMARFRLGIVLARQQNNEAAAAEFEQALRLQPTLEEAHFRLAGIYRKLGQTNAAEREMALFRSSQVAGDPHDEASGVDLRQFISVMHRSEAVPVAMQCR